MPKRERSLVQEPGRVNKLMISATDVGEGERGGSGARKLGAAATMENAAILDTRRRAMLPFCRPSGLIGGDIKLVSPKRRLPWWRAPFLLADPMRGKAPRKDRLMNRIGTTDTRTGERLEMSRDDVGGITVNGAPATRQSAFEDREGEVVLAVPTSTGASRLHHVAVRDLVRLARD